MHSVKPQRLFLAIAIPTELETRLSDATRRIRKDFGNREVESRWSPPENWHVTLVFIGESTRADEIADCARRVTADFAPFTLAVRGIGAFPEESSARVIWAGVQKSRTLLQLQSQIEASLGEIGFNLDERDYQPHLTLVRLRNPKRVREFIDSFRKKDFGKVEVQEIILYQSVSAVPFPRYVPLARFPLLGRVHDGDEKDYVTDSND